MTDKFTDIKPLQPKDPGNRREEKGGVQPSQPNDLPKVPPPPPPAKQPKKSTEE